MRSGISSASPARLKVQKIPLVRAKLADGGAIVGVKVHHDRLQEVKYVLSALHEERSSKGNKAPVVVGCCWVGGTNTMTDFIFHHQLKSRVEMCQSSTQRRPTSCTCES